MESNSVSLTQFPNRLSHADYESGRQSIVEEFSDRDGLLGIYDYGTVEHPGISDLDLMFVFDQDSTPSWVADLSTAYDPLVDELVGRGNIIVIDEQTFQQLNFIDPHLEPKHLAGDYLSRTDVDDETATYRDHASVMDWLPERVYQIHRLATADEIPVMRTLQLLKSLGYSLRIVDEQAGFESGIEFADSVTSLRSSWFDYSEQKRTERLLDMIEEAQSVGREALLFWFNRYPTTVFTEPDQSPTQDESALSYFEGLVYVSKSPGVDCYEDWIRIGIPDPWFDHYKAYANHDSTLGELIEQSLVTDNSKPTAITNEYDQYLSKKLSICSSNFEWVTNIGADSGAFRFGFLLNRCQWETDKFQQLRAELRSAIRT